MIGLNDFTRQWSDLRTDAVSAFEVVGASGWYILGREVQQFECALAEYWSLPHAVGVASGLDAIEIALRVLGCRAGDKVLTTPLSAFATTLAILKIGAVPVFCDVDEFGLVDLGAAEEALAADESIHYFVPVHLYGHALNLPKLKALQKRFQVAVMEDCAQSIGARFDGVLTGHVGALAATSFYPTKNLGAIGDGGAILARTEEHDRAARSLRDYGQVDKYQHALIGYNSRLDELQAALLRRVSLPRLDHWLEQRRRISAAYTRCIRNERVEIPGAPSQSSGCWHLFPVLVTPSLRCDFIAHLQQQKIGAGVHYPTAIPDQPAMATVEYEISTSGIERARSFCRSEVSLPVHPYLTDTEVSRVIQAVNSWRS